MKHPFEKTAKRRDRVLQVLGREFISTADAEAIRRAVEGILPVLPKSCRYDAIYRSLLPLLGARPDFSLLRRVAGAMAGDLASLRRGRPVWPPHIDPEAHTVTVQVLAARRVAEFRPGRSLGFPVLYRLRIVKGVGVGAEVDIRLSSRFIQYLAIRPNGLGFARPPRGDKLPKYRAYQHFETMVGMLVRLELSMEEGKPKVDNLRCTGALLAYNRALTEMRWRSTFPCPFRYDHACHQCPKGQESCPAATHPVDYQNRMCPSCLETEEFDPFWGDGICRRCAQKPKSRGAHAHPARPQPPGGNLPG